MKGAHVAQPASNGDAARERRAIMMHCRRSTGGHTRRSIPDVLAAIAEEAHEDELPDHYGLGDIVERFEAELAALLGKEAAVFFPTGTMTQQIALRIWCERAGSSNVAFHPTCHLETHEVKAYEHLHGLRGILAGGAHRLMTLDDLNGVAEPIGALLLELPQREIGGQLPSWDDLQAQIAWAHDRGAFVHMDGARLWESAPFYGRSHAEIAAPFDSVYVSFYKSLEALAGAALAGPAPFIAEARVWRRRHGGDLFRFYPLVLSARAALRARLPIMSDLCGRAREIAAALSSVDGIRVKPDPPQTNMMHIYLQGDRDTLMERSLTIARDDGVALFTALSATDVPGCSVFELVIADLASALTPEEAGEYFGALMRGSGNLSGMETA